MAFGGSFEVVLFFFCFFGWCLTVRVRDRRDR